MIGEVVDVEFTTGEEEVLHKSTLIIKLLLRRTNQFQHFADLGGVLHIIRLYIRVIFFEVGNVKLALIKEDGATITIQSFSK